MIISESQWLQRLAPAPVFHRGMFVLCDVEWKKSRGWTFSTSRGWTFSNAIFKVKGCDTCTCQPRHSQWNLAEGIQWQRLFKHIETLNTYWGSQDILTCSYEACWPCQSSELMQCLHAFRWLESSFLHNRFARTNINDLNKWHNLHVS